MAAWVRQRDTQHKFATIPSQEAERFIASPPLTPELREAFRHSLHVITFEGRILRAGRATLFVLEGVGWGGGWLPRLLTRQPFIFFTEIGYGIVARNRTFFSRFLFPQQ